MEEIRKRKDIRKEKVLLAGIIYMGLGHILYLKQYAKGILYMLIETILLFFVLVERGPSGIFLNGNGPVVQAVCNMITLGGDQSALPIRERKHAMFLMNDGLIVTFILIAFLIMYILSVRDILSIMQKYKSTGKLPAKQKFQASGSAFPMIALMPTIVLLAMFVVLPLVFSALIAFTDYSAPNHMPPGQQVSWVGTDNFFTLFSEGQQWTLSFGRVAVWTVIWALLSTITTFFGGLIITLVLRSQKIRIPQVFRAIFILPYAVPSLISMMVWANLLNGTIGPINMMLKEIGLKENIYWLTDPLMAKVTMVIVNLWLGFPYFMMMTTSIMTSISQEIFEAAAVDGANQVQSARKIVFPLVMQQAQPLLIMSFCNNLNNFGIAYFLTSGGPAVAGETTITKAGATDILISWIYKLTNDSPQKYQYAAVLAILIFAVMTPFAVYNYLHSKSFKESGL